MLAPCHPCPSRPRQTAPCPSDPSKISAPGESAPGHLHHPGPPLIPSQEGPLPSPRLLLGKGWSFAVNLLSSFSRWGSLAGAWPGLMPRRPVLTAAGLGSMLQGWGTRRLRGRLAAGPADQEAPAAHGCGGASVTASLEGAVVGVDQESWVSSIGFLQSNFPLIKGGKI